jgi:hypothetical protein
MAPSAYWATVARRSYRETWLFWTLHRNWTFLAPIATGALAMWIKSDPTLPSRVAQLAEYTAISYVVAWVGTFLLNVARAPRLIHEEALRGFITLPADAETERREAIVARLVLTCVTQSKAALARSGAPRL